MNEEKQEQEANSAPTLDTEEYEEIPIWVLKR
jgi:hypothetical protein